ncbi:MAG TPA: hypothetical protein QGF40_08730, partial [Candidatus Marinimicrobia bacterium]|nr:hypothetical protein [Candidatus Neomarinimicrobiota bacterium]
GLSLKDVITGQVRVKYRDGSYGPLREIRVGSGYWSQDRSVVVGFHQGVEVIEIKSIDGTARAYPASADTSSSF